MRTENWELKRVKDVEWTQDASGIYCIVHRVAKRMHDKQYAMDYVECRIDIMADDDSPLMSFIGSPDDVRKAAMQWLEENGYKLSAEHAAYIGAELQRAYENPYYVQQ